MATLYLVLGILVVASAIALIFWQRKAEVAPKVEAENPNEAFGVMMIEVVDNGYLIGPRLWCKELPEGFVLASGIILEVVTGRDGEVRRFVGVAVPRYWWVLRTDDPVRLEALGIRRYTGEVKRNRKGRVIIPARWWEGGIR